jgi:hypothetical protein
MAAVIVRLLHFDKLRASVLRSCPGDELPFASPPKFPGIEDAVHVYVLECTTFCILFSQPGEPFAKRGHYEWPGYPKSSTQTTSIQKSP